MPRSLATAVTPVTPVIFVTPVARTLAASSSQMESISCHLAQRHLRVWVIFTAFSRFQKKLLRADQSHHSTTSREILQREHIQMYIRPLDLLLSHLALRMIRSPVSTWTCDTKNRSQKIRGQGHELSEYNIKAS